MPNLESISAVIFDLDGTIADTECFHKEAWELTAEAYQLDAPGEQIFRSSLGISSIKTLQRLLPESWRDRIPEIAEYKFQTTMNLLRGHEIRILPGFEDTYARLRTDNVKVGICTSAREENVRALLESKGPLPEILLSLAEKIVWKEMCTKGKPAPDPLQLTMRLLGSPDPTAVLYVGDAHADYACAQAAGVHYLHFAENRMNIPEALPDDVRVISDHRQLLEFIPAPMSPAEMDV